MQQQQPQNPGGGAYGVVGGGGYGQLAPQQPVVSQVDAEKLGIHTIPKGDCAGCDQAIVGPVVIAIGRMWHPEHFTCSQCGGEVWTSF